MHKVWAVKVVCDAKTTPSVANYGHRKYEISSRCFSFMRCLLVVQDEGWAVLCSLTNNMQDMNQSAGTRVYISLPPAYTSILVSSRLHLDSLFFSYWTHHQHPEQSRHHMTCTKQPLSFQNTPNNLHNFVRSLWASFRCVPLYHNANASDVDSFSTRSDGTKGKPQKKGEGNS